MTIHWMNIWKNMVDNMELVLNESRKSVSVNGKEQNLTPKEFGILAFLMHNPGVVYSSEEIYRNTWHMEPFDCKGLISVHVRHIREKIEADPRHPQYLLLKWGYGYCYRA